MRISRVVAVLGTGLALCLGAVAPAKRYSDLVSWQQILTTSTDATALNKQIWDTEINYGLAGPGGIPDTDYTGDVATAYIARTFVDSIRFGIDSVVTHRKVAC